MAGAFLGCGDYDCPMGNAAAQMPPWARFFLIPAILLTLWIIGSTVGTVLVIFVVSVVISLILNPVVRMLRRLHVPRGLAVLAVFVSLAAGIAGGVSLVISPVRGQIEDIRQRLPDYTDQAQRQVQSIQAFLDRRGINVDLQAKASGAIDSVQRWLGEQADNAVNYSLNLLSWAVTAILILVASIYMLLDAPRIALFARKVAGPDGAAFLRRTERTLSEYVKAQLLVSAIIGVSAGIVLWIYGVTGIFDQGANYAVAFAAWVFVMEFIPYIGPILGAILPLVIALLSSPFSALWVLVAFVAIHQLEGHVVVPKIMGTAVGVHPLVVIFGLLIGEQLYGLGGVLLALPMVVIVKEAVVFAVAKINHEPFVEDVTRVVATASPPTPAQGGERPASATRELPTVAVDPTASPR